MDLSSRSNIYLGQCKPISELRPPNPEISNINHPIVNVFSEDKIIGLNDYAPKKTNLKNDNIAEKRRKLDKILSPQVLAELDKINLRNEKKDEEKLLNDKKCGIKESNSSSLLQDNNNKIQDVDENVKDIVNEAKKNKWLHMNEIEYDKLKWTSDVKESKEKSEILRFHFNGSLIYESNKEEVMNLEENKILNQSLRHHGDDADKEGYTITELFILLRSSQKGQQNIAINTICNILKKSQHDLLFVHELHEPFLLDNLIKCGLPFVVRWILQNVTINAPSTYLYCLKLLYSTILPCSTAKVLNQLKYWPTGSSIHLGTVGLSQCNKLWTLNSENDENISDEKLMSLDVIATLIWKTNLVVRLAYLVNSSASTSSTPSSLIPSDDIVIIEIITKLIQHSPHAARSVCIDNKILLDIFTTRHLSNVTVATSSTLELIKISLESDSEIAFEVTKNQQIIQSVYRILMESNSSESVRINCICVLKRLIKRDLHMAPIRTVLPSLCDELFECISDHSSTELCINLLQMISIFLNTNPDISGELEGKICDLIQNISISLDNFLNDKCRNYQLLSAILDLLTNYLKFQISQQDCSIVLIDRFYDAILSKFLCSKLIDTILLDVNNKSILGYEYRNTNQRLIQPDLINLKEPNAQIPVCTRNPNFIDFKPFFLDMSTKSVLLRAILDSVFYCVNQSTVPINQLEFYSSIQLLFNRISIEQYLNKVVKTPIESMFPQQLQYYTQFQMELDLFASLLLVLSQLTLYTTDVYCAAVKILPYLGPNLIDTNNQLLQSIIFNNSILAQLPHNTQLICESQAELLTLYQSCRPNTTYSEEITKCLHVQLNQFLPVAWYDVPFKLFGAIGSNRVSESTKSQFPMVNCLDNLCKCMHFIGLLDNLGIVSTNADKCDDLNRLTLIMSHVCWTELMSNAWYDIFKQVLPKYLTDLSRLSMPKPQEDRVLLMNTQYFSTSFGDGLLSNMILYGCAMRFPVKSRKRLWHDYHENLRNILLQLDGSIVPVFEYLEPLETDFSVLRSQWKCLHNGNIRKSTNEFIYWIAVSHINGFIFTNQNTSNGSDNDRKDKMRLRQLITYALLKPQTRNRDYVNDIRMFKRWNGKEIELFQQLPENRENLLLNFVNTI